MIIYQENDYNKRINEVIQDINEIKIRLEEKRNEKDKIARQVLAEKYNETLSRTLQGDYQIEISPKYHISIYDIKAKRDVTAVLSTGQNVVVSLSFLSALIQTAKSLSENIQSNEKYGVIMDAAMSNLDENHIERTSRLNLLNMDQLIFMSFKRQLRDEMYSAIKDNVGKAYEIKKDDSGNRLSRQINLEELGDFIQSIEGE